MTFGTPGETASPHPWPEQGFVLPGMRDLLSHSPRCASRTVRLNTCRKTLFSGNPSGGSKIKCFNYGAPQISFFLVSAVMLLSEPSSAHLSNEPRASLSQKQIGFPLEGPPDAQDKRWGTVPMHHLCWNRWSLPRGVGSNSADKLILRSLWQELVTDHKIFSISFSFPVSNLWFCDSAACMVEYKLN